ncbi:hypothetical protein GCM10027277_42350 [Pseudoduganella ginsengisoli]|uniref:DUF2807 domain-containing protein n=1 Tax=Pseudoduganella ginsengisoli TaxID=1462440 RepID=A0A6L6Q8M5_9BURK|nr:DUF2807 domain-containing protein [Pseudoduganella ginsengisoli]MTW05804.1 DUF2807 domain-containing protein [Pseudoduganella ginsengisoli]
MRRFLILAAASATAAAALSAPARADEKQVRAVQPFTAIDSRGPLSITVEGGKAQTLTVSGNAEFVSRVATEVVNGELKIYLKDKGPLTLKGEPRITITMPTLVKFIGEGAGETILKNINGERLDVSYQGAGSFTASGKVALLRMRAEGVGEVNTKGLEAERADVNFNGLGSVKVTAKDTLNAVVNGMGSLNYYGKPRTVNKTVNGIGSVNAGD